MKKRNTVFQHLDLYVRLSAQMGVQMKNYKSAVLWALLAAVLYAAGSPFSKVLLQYIPPAEMAAFLYLGAGTGMGILGMFKIKLGNTAEESNLGKNDVPYTAGMILLDIAAPVFLMIGLNLTTAANASLLNNFEIAATALVALLVFGEKVSRNLWIAISLITISSIMLTFEDVSGFSFSIGSLFVLLACLCWGFENNCTRKLSGKNPIQIVIIKGLGSGLGSLVLALLLREHMTGILYICCAMVLGFISYGLSIFFYVRAQRELGAAKTSTYYAVAPFISVILSRLIFRELPDITFFLAFVIMVAGTYYASRDTKKAAVSKKSA